MTPYREEQIGEARLILGDCREVLPTLGNVDAVVTDPPYGIGVDRTMAKQGGTQYGRAAAAKSFYEHTNWDDRTPEQEIFERLMGCSKSQIIFGGNYFDLPPSRCWLVWDKENGDNEFADCELAWTNLDKPVRRVSWLWNGMLRRGKEERVGHPTQKPLEVMRWCIGHLPGDVHTVLDPFMGSGTTGVACVKTGKSFIGIEIHEPYFDIACKRIDEAYKQGDMFIERPKPAKQESLLLTPTPKRGKHNGTHPNGEA
jgi:DNA modification methylase